jgi:DNA helicase-2/ATP-dependent DNA helicase PcrA
MEEERRLAYVAATRAMTRLYLSDAEGAANDGLFKYPSRFIFDLGEENVEYVAPLDKALEETARSEIRLSEATMALRQAAFSVGDRVTHPVFGAGTVVAVSVSEMCYAIQFDRFGTERAIRFGGILQREGQGGAGKNEPSTALGNS